MIYDTVTESKCSNNDNGRMNFRRDVSTERTMTPKGDELRA
jgi:hypothetical protein